jgi:uncharacterized protein DUF6232
MQGAVETTIFETSGVFITNARCILGNTTYATANIASVRLGMKSEAGGFILIGVVLACGALLAFGNGAGGVLLGIILAALSALFFYLATKAKTYYVVLHTNAGEVQAISSKDSEFVTAIVDGINRAIVHRG